MTRRARWLLAVLVLLAGGSGFLLWHAVFGTPIPTRPLVSDADLPSGWRQSHDVAAVRPTWREYLRGRLIVGHGGARHPRSVLEAHVRRVVILGHLTRAGRELGGTYHGGTVYLVTQDERRYSKRFMERVLQAEISSILLERQGALLDRAAWIESNPAGFEYVGKWSPGVTGERDPSAVARGFLSEYAEVSLEEDFNAVASALLVCDESACPLLQESESLRRKWLLALRFFIQLDAAYADKLAGCTCGMSTS